MQIIIAEINPKPGSTKINDINTFCEKIIGHLNNKNVKDAKVNSAFNFETITDIVERTDNKVLIFSSLPNNFSYAPNKYEIKFGKRVPDGTSYLNSRRNIEKLLILHRDIELFIITNASESILPDRHILMLTFMQKISIKREIDWENDNYKEKYEEYILAEIDQTIAKNCQKS